MACYLLPTYTPTSPPKLLKCVNCLLRLQVPQCHATSDEIDYADPFILSPSILVIGLLIKKENSLSQNRRSCLNDPLKGLHFIGC